MLVVLDANIFVSAAITPAGAARSVVQAGLAGRFDYVVCPTMLDEIVDVLARPKTSRFVPPGAAERFAADVRGRARLEDDPAGSPRVSRDPRDDYLIALAVSVGADAVVTGDNDLLELSDPPVTILALRVFIDMLDASAD